MKKRLLWIACTLFVGILITSGQITKTNDRSAISNPHIDPTKTLIYQIGSWHNVLPGSFRYPIVTDTSRFFYPVYLQNTDFTVLNSFDKSVAGISGENILNEYIQAIGGVTLLQKVQTIECKGTIRVKNMKLGFYERKQAPNLDYIAMSVDRDTVMRSTFDGDSGFNQHISDKKTLSPNEIKERNLDYLGLFNQQFYASFTKHFYLSNIVIDSAKNVPCYRLDIRMPSGKAVSEFFDPNKHLLVKSIEKEVENGQVKTIIKEFDSYKSFNQILFPTFITINTSTDGIEQHLELQIKSVDLTYQTSDN